MINWYDDIPSSHEGATFRDPPPVRERESLGWLVCDFFTAVLLVGVVAMVALGI